MIFKRPISKNYPILAPVIKELKIANKSLQFVKYAYKLNHSKEYMKYKVYKNQSLVKRKLGNTSEKLIKAKIHNLKLAIPNINNLVIAPHKLFSFWKAIGKPTYKNGYVDGMLLADGKVIEGVGGGLCQLANMLHWLFLHTDMVITEHWHHDYDIFPDDRRALPFGSGAGVLYNYFDLQFFNPTDENYTINITLNDKFLTGEIWSDKPQKIKYSILEEDSRFYRINEQLFRENNLYKISIDKTTGKIINKEFIKHNNSKVLYDHSDNAATLA